MISLITRGIYIYRWLIPIKLERNIHIRQPACNLSGKRMVSKISKERMGSYSLLNLNVLVFHIVLYPIASLHTVAAIVWLGGALE